MRRLIIAGVIVTIASLAPSLATAGDQEVAQQVAANLRNSGRLKGYAIDVKAKDGRIWLSGTVTNKDQMSAALRIANQTGGVDEVVSDLSIAPGSTGTALRQPGMPVIAAAATEPAQAQIQAQAIRQRTGGGSGVPIAYAPTTLGGNGQIMPASANMMEANNAAMMESNMAMSQGQGAEPIPSYVPGTGGGVAPAHFDRPNMPNYAWPSYAAHPNYAAVTYPKQYSPTAWPYIGPFYPYPQVPLGWRKVTLEWDDGWWWLDFDDRAHHYHRSAAHRH